MAEKRGRRTAEFPDPPRNPDEWEACVGSDVVAGIPSTFAELTDDQNYTRRDVSEGLSAVFFVPSPGNKEAHPRQQPGRGAGSGMDVSKTANFHYLFEALPLFEWGTSSITPSPVLTSHASGLCYFVRVLTAKSPTAIVIDKYSNGASRPYSFSIWASVLDQPWSIRLDNKLDPSGWSETLDLGAKTGHVGAKITCAGGIPQVDYYDNYPVDDNPLFEGYLRTELRLATALFWSHPVMAFSICAYLVKLTSNPPHHIRINCQAASLGQQLATIAMMEKNVTYVPELILDDYEDDTRDRLDVVSSFNAEYERFQDNAGYLQNQLDAWDVMLDHVGNEMRSQEQRRDQALERYSYASDVAKNCTKQFDDDNGELDKAKQRFDEGVRQWKEEQMRKLFFAMFGFIFGLAELCTGSLDGIGAVQDAVGRVSEVAEGPGKVLSSGSLQNLGDCMASLGKIFLEVDKVVGTAKAPGSDPDGMPPTDSITGSPTGDADAAAIVTLGEWDKWVLDSDHQMEVAVNNDIDGASEYQLVLRKHAVNGKMLAQAQANAVQAGREYVKLQMNLRILENDKDNLEQLEEGYEGQLEAYSEAEEKFYDSLMTLKVGVLIDLLKVVAAYRYYTLKDYALALGPEVSVQELKKNLSDITGAVREVDASWDKDFQTFEYHSSSEKLPSVNHGSLVQGLKDKDTRSVSFTLAPTTDGSSRLNETESLETKSLERGNSQGLPSDFHNGYHWRMWGMEPLLRGAVPLPDKLENGCVTVNMWITTEGMFSDIEKDGNVLYFTAQPQSKLFSYELGESGEVNITTNAIYPAEKHMDRTPFTEWTVELERESFEALNLDGLKGLGMHYKGKYMPIKDARRDSGFAQH